MIPTPPSKSTVPAMIAGIAVVLAPLLNVAEVEGKYRLPVGLIEPGPVLLTCESIGTVPSAGAGLASSVVSGSWTNTLA